MKCNCNFFKGSGFSSEVFEGVIKNQTEENSINSKVAIKILKLNNSMEFFKEAAVAARLSHENVVKFIGVCLKNNCIIMELLEGGQLLKFLKGNNRQAKYTCF